MKSPKIYALYKGEEMLDMGTAQEIADRRGVKPESILYYMSPAYKRKGEKSKNPRERLCTVSLDDDDED